MLLFAVVVGPSSVASAFRLADRSFPPSTTSSQINQRHIRTRLSVSTIWNPFPWPGSAERTSASSADKSPKVDDHHVVVDAPPVLSEQQVEDILELSLKKMQLLMDPDLYQVNDGPLATMLTKCQSATTVGPSKIPNAGTGLFAQRGIPKGSIIGLYPVHNIGLHYYESGKYTMLSSVPTENYNLESSCYVLNMFGDRSFPFDNPIASDVMSQLGKVFVDANPTVETGTAWNGHRINDGAAIVMDQKSLSLDEKILKYYETSLDKQSCMFVPIGPAPLCAAVATKDIQKGDEIYICYGHRYWLPFVGNANDFSTTASSSNDDDRENPQIQRIEQSIGSSLSQVTKETKKRYTEVEDELFALFCLFDDFL